MGIISDAIHIFFDSLTVVLGMISFLIPLKNKIIVTRIKIFNLDDIFTFFKKIYLMFIISYYFFIIIN